MQILLQTFGTIIITAIVIMFFIDDPFFRNLLSRRLGLQGDSKIVGPHSMKGSRAIVETIFLEEEGEITGYVWIEGSVGRLGETRLCYISRKAQGWLLKMLLA